MLGVLDPGGNAGSSLSPVESPLSLRVPSVAGLLATLLLVAATRAPAVGTPTARGYSYAFEDVLGTSLDLRFTATHEVDAARARDAALAEIERLRRILSTWDETSEVAVLVRDGVLAHPSADLLAVLRGYDRWRVASGGAYTPRIAPLTAAWRRAAATDRLPEAAVLRSASAAALAPAWRIDAGSGAIMLLGDGAIDINSLGKGYVIDRTVAAIRAAVPGLAGGLVDIGGDIRTWGRAPTGDGRWTVGVADPLEAFDNAVPIVRLAVGDRAVSSSGRYARGFTILGRHYSHIIDPRDGRPADAVAGVTVVAADNATANALATTLSVLGPEQGEQLLATVPGAEALWTLADGSEVRTAGFAAFELPGARGARPHAPLGATLQVDLSTTRPYRHRPYVAVWITDTTGAHVRTLAFWGDRWKYQRELSKWWNAFGDDRELVDAVTRATRPAGEYTFEWDGANQAGESMPAGPYRFWLEAAYENGPHSVGSVVVTCGGGAAAAGSGAIDAATAFAGAKVQCGSATGGGR